MTDVGTTLEDLEHFLAEHHLVGAGLRREGQAPSRQGNTAAHWAWDGIRRGLARSGEIVTMGSGGMTGMRSVVGIEARKFPIWMNAQILMPGERTVAHRNLRSETRLICEAGPGAVMVCEFESYPLARGDVVISPAWTYHDHWNQGTEPAVWIDGYDNGYNRGVNINEKLPDGVLYENIDKPAGYGHATLGHVRHLSGEPVFPLPPMHYPWAETEAALAVLRESEADGDPYDGLQLTFTSPVDGGPTLPTIAWHVQLFYPRQKTLSHRHNSTTWYHAFEGEGVTVIEGERLEWHRGDLFAVPAWKWHHHENTADSDTILFSIDDWPAMTKLGFYVKEEEPGS